MICRRIRAGKLLFNFCCEPRILQMLKISKTKRIKTKTVTNGAADADA